MADPLIRRARALVSGSSIRAKKWTYLTWCDLRNHPLMLVGALLGAIVFTLYTVNSVKQGDRITTIEKTVKVPRRCQVARLPTLPATVILTCVPATKAEAAAAKRAAKTAARRYLHPAGPSKARTGGQNGGPTSPGRSGSPNGSQGVAPSPAQPHQPSHQPGSGSPSPGGSSSPPAPQPQPRASPPPPGVTTPPLGPIPSITVPLPSPSLPPLPSLPGS